MTSGSRLPQGRAGRLRLRRGLRVAHRGADLLERKSGILRAEEERLRAAADAADHTWRESVRQAETWLVRAVLLGGQQALAAAAAGVGAAEVALGETTSMGVRHPAEADCTVPPRAAEAAAPGNTALVHAENAYRQAVRAAVEYAALSAAARLVGAEARRTRRRIRALRRHRIPRLEEQLGRIGQALEQDEHEDAVRRGWAGRRDGEGRGR
ncbi:V-type ATP synthase subunit D [Streptomyces palmae]|uniref:V-type ATPase, D subunit n=1 Tax=Streptomyces palmae TaxID=1701085 RepID=A0A4Z0HCZ4_9ACTN|nr:V-type ATP synthase subunit D [Streptomyces palmae]TGB15185.1 V-type ATPase, D subunit [Streptomyces palmae]